MADPIQPRVTPPVGGPPALRRVQPSKDRQPRRPRRDEDQEDPPTADEDNAASRKGRHIDERC